MAKRKAAKVFNGKSMFHWQREADKLVMDCLVRAISAITCSKPRLMSIVQKLASRRLIAIAKAENPMLYKEKCDERDRCFKWLCKAEGYTNPKES